MSHAISDFAFAEPGGRGEGVAFNPSMLSAIPDDVVGAVTKSVNCMDTSRRVAWAKMYAALERGERAQRELVNAREDVELLSRIGGFAYGVLRALKVHGIFNDYVKGSHQEFESYFPRGAIRAGRESGSSWLQRFSDAMPEVTAYSAALRDRAAAEREWLQHKVEFETDNAEVLESVRKRIERRLAHHYGFKGALDMHCWLAQHKASNE